MFEGATSQFIKSRAGGGPFAGICAEAVESATGMIQVQLDPKRRFHHALRAMNSIAPLVSAATAFAVISCAAPARSADPVVPATAPTSGQLSNASGQPVKRAPTDHVTNYDEAKVGNYTLPDPLVLNDGEPVRDAAGWYHKRRPEILELYRRYIYGRVPEDAPKTSSEVESVDSQAFDGSAVRKVVATRFGNGPHAPLVHVVIYIPARHVAPVPVLLHLTFRGEPPPASEPVRGDQGGRPGELGPIAEILARGYAYAFYRYTDLQPDSAETGASGVEALTAPPGGDRAPDAWGTISVWAWGASRILDYLQTDPALDAKRVALIGHSRLGKTVLWAGAQDPRFALVFSSCAGEMGSALSRRDYGETVDDMVHDLYWQFAPNFRQYAGHWNNLPVDAHMLIALNAPHPVLITAGSRDLWADPRGEFLAAVAAGPVYRLLGVKDLGATELPSLDMPLDSGNLAFLYHDGPHAIIAEDWKTFLDYADRYLRRPQ